jgi:hypothetical protein
VWRPLTSEKLSFSWKRFTSSSTLGARKKGLPNRNDGANPIPVSAGTEDGIAERGRFSREYVRWNSFSLFEVIVLNRLRFKTLIFDGPSTPFAELPYVGTSKVWLVFFE